MLFRNLLIIALLCGCYWGAKQLYRLLTGQKRSYQEAKKLSPKMDEALKLCDKIRQDAPEDQSLLINRHLEAVLDKLAGNIVLTAKLENSIRQTENDLAKNRNEQTNLTPIIEESLKKQQLSLQELRERNLELNQTTTQLIILLQNLHLSILEALSSQEGLDTMSTQVLLDKLEESTNQITATSRIAKKLEALRQ